MKDFLFLGEHFLPPAELDFQDFRDQKHDVMNISAPPSFSVISSIRSN